MTIDYNLHIGAVAVCRGPLWVGGPDPVWALIVDKHSESLYAAQTMCGEGLVKGAGAWVLVPNDGRGIGRNDGDASADALPVACEVESRFRVDFADELTGLRKLFRSVEVKAGVYQWAS
jgi:hypothetical protein